MRIALLTLSLALVGCVTPAAAGTPTADIVVTTGTQGRLASSEAPARRRAPWIEFAGTPESFEDLWLKYVPGKPDEEASAVDFKARSAVFLLLGPQPTGGYAIEPIDVKIEGAVIRVRARLLQPMSPADFTTQAITAPFAVVAVPAMPFDRIEWIDADGRLLATYTPQ